MDCKINYIKLERSIPVRDDQDVLVNGRTKNKTFISKNKKKATLVSKVARITQHHDLSHLSVSGLRNAVIAPYHPPKGVFACHEFYNEYA